MKRLLVAAAIAALAGIPATTPAASPAAPARAPAPAPGETAARPAPEQPGAEGADASDDYAAREKAAPQLAEFSGGDNGIYIGTGALIAIAVVLLILAL